MNPSEHGYTSQNCTSSEPISVRKVLRYESNLVPSDTTGESDIFVYDRENRRIEVQANCVFKDAQGFTVDETPFRTVILDENATQDVSFEAFNLNAAKYTIRVREAR